MTGLPNLHNVGLHGPPVLQEVHQVLYLSRAQEHGPRSVGAGGFGKGLVQRRLCFFKAVQAGRCHALAAEHIGQSSPLAGIVQRLYNWNSPFPCSEIRAFFAN